MMAREEGGKKKSEYFLHTPGTQAQKTFFLSAGGGAFFL